MFTPSYCQCSLLIYHFPLTLSLLCIDLHRTNEPTYSYKCGVFALANQGLPCTSKGWGKVTTDWHFSSWKLNCTQLKLGSNRTESQVTTWLSTGDLVLQSSLSSFSLCCFNDKWHVYVVIKFFNVQKWYSVQNCWINFVLVLDKFCLFLLSTKVSRRFHW